MTYSDMNSGQPLEGMLSHIATFVENQVGHLAS